MSFLEPRVSFPSNFASFFSVKKHNSFIHFYLNLYMLWTKGMQSLRLSTAYVKFYQICTLIGSFYWKYTKFQLRKYREVTSHDTEESCKIWRKLTCGLENDLGNLTNFHENTLKCQNWNFDYILLSQVENLWAKKLQGSYV